jgi:uncharacterized protein
MEIKFLTEPALMIGKTLVVADLHIGIEYEISHSGITIPSQVEKLEKRLDSIIKTTRAKHLVILGDVKHQVPSISWQEYREIPEFLSHFKKIKISIVKGNHDGNIERLAPSDVDIYEPQGFVLNDVLLTHGQAWPDKGDMGADYIVMGHVHPAVEFWTGNFRTIEPCWLRCEVDNEKLHEKFKVKADFKQGVIMPSFNHLIGGMAFNSKSFEPLGPLLTNDVFIWKDAEVYLLDGTLLGSLKDLKKFSKKD